MFFVVLAVKPAVDDLREVRETRKTCNMRETCEEKGCTHDSAKTDNTRFVIQLFSRTIKFYPLLHKKIPLSYA